MRPRGPAQELKQLFEVYLIILVLKRARVYLY